jgi:hypothetical protein
MIPSTARSRRRTVSTSRRVLSIPAPLNGTDGAKGSMTLAKPIPARRIAQRRAMAEYALISLLFLVAFAVVSLAVAWALQ